jgi:hypothetical protein
MVWIMQVLLNFESNTAGTKRIIIYIHIFNLRPVGVRSPVDELSTYRVGFYIDLYKTPS